MNDKLKAPASVHDEAKYVEEKANELYLKLVDCKPEQLWQLSTDLIRQIVKDCKPKVNREWVYYFCAYINAGYRFPADDKARVNHAIKKLKEIGVEVENK